MTLHKYNKFKKITEVRTPKRCPVVDFHYIRVSPVYKDMISMGFEEVLAANPQGIETSGNTEQRNYKDRVGNIAFYHPDLSTKPGYPHYNIKHDGGVKIVKGSSKSDPYEFPYLITDLSNRCMKFEDYFMKMGFLMKFYCQRMGLPISDDELYDINESYVDLITRKLATDAGLVNKINLPLSIEKTMAGAGYGIIKRGGAFNDAD